MSLTDTENGVLTVGSNLRNEPVQARSAARLEALLDAAASIVDEIGFERLTTAMVAERAGASIGTVYRYFPDRIALLQALGARNFDRVIERVGAEIVNPAHENWFTALSASFGVLIVAFQNEPGFRGLRVGDVIDLRPAPTERTYKSLVAERLLDGLVERFGIEVTEEVRFTFEASVEISEALAVRSFSRKAEGEEQYLVLGQQVVYGLLAPFFGNVSPA